MAMVLSSEADSNLEGVGKCSAVILEECLQDSAEFAVARIFRDLGVA